MPSCRQYSPVHTNKQSFHTFKKQQNESFFPSLTPEQWSLSSIKRLLYCKELFSNDARHICCDISAGKVIFWKVRSPAIKSIFLEACASNELRVELALRQRPNKVGVMIGMDSHAWEKQVSFIGSHWCAHSYGDLWLVERRHHRSEEEACCCRACLWAWGCRDGGSWGWGREGTTKNRPPGSWASKASLTESIWTTVNRRQPVCWLPLSWIFTGSVPTNTCCPARLSKGASARVIPPRRFFFFSLWPGKTESRLKGSKTPRIVNNHYYLKLKSKRIGLLPGRTGMHWKNISLF